MLKVPSTLIKCCRNNELQLNILSSKKALSLFRIYSKYYNNSNMTKWISSELSSSKTPCKKIMKNGIALIAPDWEVNKTTKDNTKTDHHIHMIWSTHLWKIKAERLKLTVQLHIKHFQQNYFDSATMKINSAFLIFFLLTLHKQSWSDICLHTPDSIPQHCCGIL